MTNDRVIEAERLGQIAARFFAQHVRAQIVAVFERSLYLQAERSFVCLGDARIGDGPINVIFDAAGYLDVVARSRAGERVEIAGGNAAGPAWRFDVRGADIWTPAAWPAPAPFDVLDGAMTRVLGIARSMLPVGGLLPLVLADDGAVAGGGAFERLAAPRLERLERWLRARLDSDADAAGAPPVDLLGLGPGLTPSGDDALCGVMLALDAIASPRAAGAQSQLAAAVLRESAAATTALSAQFLAAAIEGQGSALLHAFIAALIGGETERLAAMLAELARVGHSSGLDAAAGVIVVLRALKALAAADRSTRSP